VHIADLAQAFACFSDRQKLGLSVRSALSMEVQKDFVMNYQSRAQGYFPGSFFRRSNRIIVNQNGYHYRTRSGKTVGPFATEIDAIVDLDDFIQRLIFS